MTRWYKSIFLSYNQSAHHIPASVDLPVSTATYQGRMICTTCIVCEISDISTIRTHRTPKKGNGKKKINLPGQKASNYCIIRHLSPPHVTPNTTYPNLPTGILQPANNGPRIVRVRRFPSQIHCQRLPLRKRCKNRLLDFFSVRVQPHMLQHHN